jgi:hypothetical protein
VSVAVGERHGLTDDLDYRIPHRLDTETPVDIREQLTFDDARRIADGNEFIGLPSSMHGAAAAPSGSSSTIAVMLTSSSTKSSETF